MSDYGRGGGIGVDAEIDLGPLFLRLCAGLDEQNALRRREMDERRAALRAATPVDFHCSGTAVVGAAPSPVTTRCLVLPNPPSPDQGHVWLLRSLTVARGDAELTNSLAGTAWVFVGGPPSPAQQLATLSPIGLRTAFATLPATSTWTGRQISVKASEYLYVVITGGTQNQVAFVDAVVEDYQEHASAGSFEL